MVRWRRALSVRKTPGTRTFYPAEGGERHGLADARTVVDVTGRDRLETPGAHLGIAVGDLRYATSAKPATCFFFKQWGVFPKGKYGCALDGKECKAVPPVPFLTPRSVASGAFCRQNCRPASIPRRSLSGFLKFNPRSLTRPSEEARTNHKKAKEVTPCTQFKNENRSMRPAQLEISD